MVKDIRRNIMISKENIIFFVFIVFYFSYLIFLSEKLILSWDEPCSMHTSANNLSEVISLSYDFEGQPPAYFIILSLWRKIDGGIFFARFLSIIFTILSAIFLYKILRLYFDKIHTKWVIVLFLLNPYTVRFSVEIRLYSMLIFLTLIACYTFYLIYFRDQKKYKIVFIVIGLVGIYTQYYFVFIVVSFSLVLLIIKGWYSFKDFIFLAIPIAILSLPNLMYIEEGFKMHNNTKLDYTINERVYQIVSATTLFLIPAVDITIGRLLIWAFRIFFLLIFSHSLLKLYIQHKSDDKHKSFGKIIVILFLMLVLMISFTIVYTLTNLVFANHYLTIIFPFICISLTIFGSYNRIIKNTIYGVFALYFIFVLFDIYRPPYIKSDNSKEVAEIIQKVEQPNEPILFYFNYRVLPFQYYYNGKNTLRPLPELKFDQNFYNNFFQDTTQLNQYIKKSTNNNHSFFIVTGNDPGLIIKRKLTNQIIDTYLKNNYIITMDTSFQGIHEYEDLRLRHLLIKHK